MTTDSTSMEEWLGDYQLTQELMTIVHPALQRLREQPPAANGSIRSSPQIHETPTPRLAKTTHGVQQATRR